MMLFDVKLLDQFPMKPGVYLMKDAENKIIYVGKANVLKTRVKQYFASTGDSRPMIPFLIRQIAHIDTIIVPSEKEALLLENTLIKKHQPKFNAILKDDKSFISLMINNRHPWPMIRLIRYKGEPKEDGLYFGPYTSAYSARQTYEILTRLFPLRQCSDEELKRRTRPCLLYSIKRCIAPCVGKCSKEEYDTYVDGAVKFLKGQDKEILKELYADMKKASESQEFEHAAAILRTIRQIEHVIDTTPLVVKVSGKNTDALAIYREGEEVMLIQLLFREGKLVGSEHYSFSNILEDEEDLLSSFILQHYTHQKGLPDEILLPLPLKDADLLSEILADSHKRKKIAILHPQKGEKRSLVEIAEENARAIFHQEKNHLELKEKMLLDLQETLKLNRYPKRIECFDTSNISGTDPVASLVAFTNGERDSKRTRLFKIKTALKGDDYGAMREVLTRHLTRSKQADDLPDLIILDGGKGHLNVGLDVFKELDIASVDLIALAKEEGRHDKGMTAERVFLPEHHDPIHLNPRSSLLFLLQKVRDEAHRKAIGFHRQRRQKRTLTSRLDTVPGIGPVKRARLLRHFGSVEKIKQASDHELSQVKGITQKDIATLKQFLQ
ncbi:MAG: excinuclease ABC subunit UvrC [Rhabdochlamydiaceae bacterium]|jgi:excinuclease ABC subunit C